MSCGCLGDGWRGALGSPNSVVGWLLVESSSKIKTLSLFLGRFFASSHAFLRFTGACTIPPILFFAPKAVHQYLHLYSQQAIKTEAAKCGANKHEVQAAGGCPMISSDPS